MSELEDKFVKRGFWINWNQGSIMGRTLTVQSRTGNIVVAILTICTGIGMAQLFNIIAFLYHQLRAQGKPSDGLFWQQQALLRTLPTPTALFADYVKLWWSWRTKSDKGLRRSWILIIIAPLFTAAAIVAGIFTSYIVKTSDLEVLVDSPFCRTFNLTSLISDGAFTSYQSSQFEDIRTHVRQCYQNISDMPTTCQNIFVQPKITFTVEPTACPWNSSMCLAGDNPAIAMDSGLLDVSRNFGWNLKTKDSLWLRRRTTCNVLLLEGHYGIVNLSSLPAGTFAFDPLPGEQGVALRYGTYPDLPPEENPEDLKYISFVTSNRTYTYSSWGMMSRFRPFQFKTLLLPWLPLPEMSRNDSDVILNIIGLNNVVYTNPVDDPLFSAHKRLPVDPFSAGAGNYQHDFIAGVIGCTDQVQYCAMQPHGDKMCTSLNSTPPELVDVLDKLEDLSDVQKAILSAIWKAVHLNDISNGVNFHSLLVSDMASGGMIPSLPSDQWIKEIVNWQDIGWAGLAITLSDTVIGAKVRDPSADSYTLEPRTEGERLLCQSFKMRKAGGFANINVFGFTFVIAFSIAIATANFFILRFFVFLQRFRRSLAPRIDRWVNDGVYQLQRRAFEANEDIAWADIEKEIPVTAEKTLVNELPIVTKSRIAAPGMDVSSEQKP